MAAKYAKTINGKVILVTGASPDGLGEEFCLTVAKYQPKLLILAGRNVDKLHATETKLANTYPDVSTKTLELDLESLSKAAKAAAEVNSWEDVPCIDLVVNNAAIMAVDFALTKDGFEKQLAVNYLAPWVFTNSIMPKILASEQPRIVFVSSSGHRWGPVRWHDHNFQNGDVYNKWKAYGQSKTAVQLYAQSLAARLGPKVQVFSLDPGVIMTSLGAHIDWSTELGEIKQIDYELGNIEAVNDWPQPKYRSKEAAIETYMYASFDSDISDYNGRYLADSGLADPFVESVRPWACSEVEAIKLWTWTERLTGMLFSV